MSMLVLSKGWLKLLLNMDLQQFGIFLCSAQNSSAHLTTIIAVASIYYITSQTSLRVSLCL